MIASTQGTMPVRLCFSSIDYRFGVCSTSSGLSAERTPGGAVTASGDNVLKARSKKKNFPSLGRLAKNLEKFHVRYCKSTALSVIVYGFAALVAAYRPLLTPGTAVTASGDIEVSELRKVSRSAVTAPSLERLQA